MGGGVGDVLSRESGACFPSFTALQVTTRYCLQASAPPGRQRTGVSSVSSDPLPGLGRNALPPDAPPHRKCLSSPHPLGSTGCSHWQLSLGLKVGAGAFYSYRCLWVGGLPHAPSFASFLFNHGSGEHFPGPGSWVQG